MCQTSSLRPAGPVRLTGAGIEQELGSRAVLTPGFLNGHPSDAQLSRADLLADQELKVLGLQPVMQRHAKPASCMTTIQHHAGTAIHREAQSEKEAQG